jgi:hypothetical protein
MSSSSSDAEVADPGIVRRTLDKARPVRANTAPTLGVRGARGRLTGGHRHRGGTAQCGRMVVADMGPIWGVFLVGARGRV